MELRNFALFHSMRICCGAECFLQFQCVIATTKDVKLVNWINILFILVIIQFPPVGQKTVWFWLKLNALSFYSANHLVLGRNCLFLV
jgi:hypothetical protein